MHNRTTRRAAACGGTLAAVLVAGALVAPAAQASTALGVPSTGSLAGTVVNTVGSVNGVVPIGSLTGTVVNTVGTVNGVVPTGTGTGLLPGTVGTVGGVVDGTVTGLLGGTGGGAGTSSDGSTTGSGTSSGGLGITVGADGDGGSLVSIGIGGTGTSSSSTKSSTGSTGTGAAGAAGAVGSAGTGGTSGSSSTSGTTGGRAVSPSVVLLRLDVRPSATTIYPVKDGYRDSVAFTLDGLTSSGEPHPITGTAVLKKGAKTVLRWSISRSDQVLTWNGRVGSKIKPGTYRFEAAALDADGHALSALSTVKVSKKQLVATTKRLKSQAVSGTHTMAAAPRAGLSKGRVTLRIRTIASGVKGDQKLIFQRGARKIVIPVRNGTHLSRAVVVPKTFTRYTIKHTWRKGTVKLKSIRYTYSYQALR